MSKRFSRFVSIVLTLCVFLSLLPIRELRADLNTHGEYSVPPFEVTYTQNASWDTTTQGAFNVENVSEEAVSSWSFEIEYLYPVTVSNIYGASLVNYFGVPTNTITVVNEVSNGNIAAGSSTSFGLMLVGEAEAPIAPVSVRLISDNTDTPVVEPTDSVFPYAIFSGSNTSDLTFNGWRSEVVGDVYTGSNYVYNGSELTLNGTVRAVGSITSPGWNINITNQVENAAVENMPDWGNSILARGNELPAIDPIRFTSEDPILTDGYCYIDGDVTISGTTFEGDAIIVASGDITYNINEISGAGRVLLYSENGNITINGTAISVNGMLYAPNGRVSISAYNTTLNGRIVANEFFFSGSILDCYANPSDLDMFYPDAEVTITPLPTDEVTITPTEVPGETPTDTPEITDIPEVTVTPSVEPTITPDIDWDTDSDGDGLPDDVEDILGTDKYNEDSDFDGLNDYIEVMIGYDPLSPDTDSNGISDAAEDFDGDGLTNSYELLVGTNPVYSDSDNDDLSDGEEVLVYSTNPLNYDSDSDGISDGEEVLIGKNPLDSSDGDALIIQTIHTDINNSDDAAIISVDITMASRGYLKYSTYVEDLYNIDVYSTDVYGRIGSPIGLNTREEFDTATITIHYDESQLGDAQESNLGVLWFDEESRFYIEQTQAVVDEVANTVTVELSHFSTYVLVDLDKWHNPILPDYSDCMYVAHGEETGYWALAYVPSLEEVESSAWFWWHLTHDNMVRLATLSSEAVHKGWVVYDFFYDWIVVNPTDNDEDGLFDFFETRGMLATNGKIYYSSPDSGDSDEDGLNDIEEFGRRFEVSRGLDGISVYITCEGVIFYFDENGILPDALEYTYFKLVFDRLEAGKTSSICVLNSFPTIADSDNDYSADNVDSLPLIKTLFTTDLGGGSFDPYDINSDNVASGYIHIATDNLQYGGRQGSIYYDSQNSNHFIYGYESVVDSAILTNQTHELYSNDGCGIIAFANFLAYMENGDCELTALEYADYLQSSSRYCTVISNFGVPIFEILYGLNDVYRPHSVNYRINQNRIEIVNNIRRMLVNGIPVIMSYRGGSGLNMYSLYGNPSEQATVTIGETLFYITDSVNHNEGHYFTVTGLIYDYNQDDYFLRISSWGRTLFISLNSYLGSTSGYSINGIVGSIGSGIVVFN